MTINWFSPIPPAQSAVGRVTARLVPILAQKAKIVIWSSGRSWVRDLEQHAEVKRYDPSAPPWREIAAAEISVYHIGNHPDFHFPIWNISRHHPGVVVLHDLKLQHFFDGLLRARKIGWPEYLAMMEFYYPNVGQRLAESYWNGLTSIDRLADVCPLTEAVCENALGIAVHSTVGAEFLTDRVNCPIGYVPLASPGIMEGENDRATPSASAENRQYKLIIFGFLGKNRRINPLLEALSGFADRKRFHLDIYGSTPDPAGLRRRVAALGLSETVTLHGFVSDAELDNALLESDLAINLRYPTMGEASASQLHIWQHALPSIVTKVGWYASLPADTVAFVRPECEKEDIQQQLAGFLADPQQYRRMGANGRVFLKDHHSPEACVDAFMDLIDAALKFRPHWSTYYLSRRAGVAMRPWFKKSAASTLLRSPACHINMLSQRE